jgi:hypothetical protein
MMRYPFARKKCIPRLVIVLTVRVKRAAQFHDQLVFDTDEIDDILADKILPLELVLSAPTGVHPGNVG